jgi:hypothetical protein
VAVGHILDAYEMYLKSLTIQLASFERLDSLQSGSGGDLSGLSRQVSNAKVAYQQGSALLADAVMLALGSAVVAAPNDTPHIALDMSALERVELVALSDSLFGPAVRDKPKDSDSGLIWAARVLRRGLAQEWRVAR